MKDWMIIAIFIFVSTAFGIAKIIFSQKLVGDSQVIPSPYKIEKVENRN